IMNFHYDVSMQEVQQKLHFLITGEKTEFPLWIQIPYSIGLGVGMLLFFNHWFNKRFNEEPSSLEIEIYNYQQNLDQYLGHYENKVNDSFLYVCSNYYRFCWRISCWCGVCCFFNCIAHYSKINPIK